MVKEKIILTIFTDPLCTWCWGLEPVIRRLETHFGNQIEIRYVTGGMVKDINEIIAQNGGDIESMNLEIESHWKGAETRHGMPVRGDGFHLFSKEYPSTYPQNIAYKAAQLTNPTKARRFLHRLREASAADYLLTSRPEVLENIAREIGLDVEAFSNNISDGSAEMEFHKDMEYAEEVGINGFPTTIVSYGDNEEVIFGYSSYDRFVRAIERVSSGKITPINNPYVTDNDKLQFITELGSMALAEVREAFDFDSNEAATKWINEMECKGRLNVRKAGNSCIVSVIISNS